MKYKYLSDQELNRLLEETEQTGMIRAPKRIQTEVFGKIAAQQPVSRKQNVLFASGKQIQLAFYSLKVGIAAAAAIFMLFRLDALQDTGWMNQVPETYIEMSERELETSEPENDRRESLHTKWTEVSQWFGNVFESITGRPEEAKVE